MDRSGIIYTARRKCQVLATKIFGYEAMTKIYFRIKVKKRCNLKKPHDLNEKICWLKIFDYPQNELVVKCTDKYSVRSYVEEKIGEEYLVPLINKWESADDIDFDALPDKYILKCNHGCAYNILVNDKEMVNAEDVRKKLRKWMNEDFSLFNAEPQYHYIKRKIICEKHLGENLVDYKFFCINGKVEFFYVSEGLLEDRNARMMHYLRDGSVAPFQRKEYKQYYFELIGSINDLIKMAEKLAKEFQFVRVDFFVIDNDIYFSELTFTPGGGYNTFDPYEYMVKFGEKL